MKEMAENSSAQKGLEDKIFDILKSIESSGDFTKNDAITRQQAKKYVEHVVANAKNWVKIERGDNTGLQFNAPALGLAMNQYLRSPAAFRQFSEDGLEIMPSTSYLQKLKSAL